MQHLKNNGKLKFLFIVGTRPKITVHLIGTNHDLIMNEVSTLLDDYVAYEKMSKFVNPYRDGKACSRIVRTLRDE